MLRPVDHGFYSYESLLDGTISLVHVAMCNDYIDAKLENEARMYASLKKD